MYVSSARLRPPDMADEQHREDEKTAEAYKIESGTVLHLVLALRGGRA